MLRLVTVVGVCGCVLLVVTGALAFWGHQRYVRRTYFSARPLLEWEWEQEWAGWERAPEPEGRHRRVTGI